MGPRSSALLRLHVWGWSSSPNRAPANSDKAADLRGYVVHSSGIQVKRRVCNQMLKRPL